MSTIRKEMEYNHGKGTMEAVKWAMARILNNGSNSGTYDSVLDFSIPSPIIDSFNEKEVGMTGIERKDKDRKEEKMGISTREDVVKIIRIELCATLQHI